VSADGLPAGHVHSAPSWFERHLLDADAVAANRELGIDWTVLKAHEGCTAARACPLDGAIGGVVLNSPAGGANPAAVEGSARLGGRVVWMPTMSSRAHRAAASGGEIGLAHGAALGLVPVVEEGRLLPEWFEVLEAIAANDMLLASGHLTCAEAAVLFTEAHRRGVERMLLNHPTMSFMEWDDTVAGELLALGVHLEIGILSDCLATALGGPEAPPSFERIDDYPHELWVFGSDLGSAHHPRHGEIMAGWYERFERAVGAADAVATMTANGLALLAPERADAARRRSLPAGPALASARPTDTDSDPHSNRRN
jgi:hypothetical protein